jgi:hypothetical protein
MEPQWIVLTLTIIGAVAIAVVGLTLCRRVRYPAGRRVDVPHPCYGRVTTIVDRAVPDIDDATLRWLAQACLRAVVVTGESWREHDRGRLDPCRQLAGFTFHFLPDAAYEAAWQGDLAPMGPRTCAVRGQIPRAIGSGPLGATIRASLIGASIERGSPTVHEVIHGLERWDSGHTNALVWGTGPDSVEGRAHARFASP